MKRILIFYSHFSPAFKAGGPVQSLRNMVELIKDDFIIDVVCSAYEYGEARQLPGIVPDQWNFFGTNLNVLYIKTAGIKKIREAIQTRKPNVIYVNGVFLPVYSWLPLMLAKIKDCPVVFAPRGMLQDGAITNGSARKLLAVFFLKSLRLHKNVLWHATDAQEKADILKHFGNSARVKIIGNVPILPLAGKKKVEKRSGDLRLVFLSLIARKKNLSLVLTLLRNIERSVVFDIYGPVKDKSYWEECLALMSGQKHQIRYCGSVNPADVRETVKKYHAFILLTKGENFGHAIYESLSTGIPAIISQYTPWGKLQDRSAGITADINSAESCREAIEKFLAFTQDEFDKLADGAFQLASEYYTSADFKEHYTEMFAGAADRQHLPSPRTQSSHVLKS